MFLLQGNDINVVRTNAEVFFNVRQHFKRRTGILTNWCHFHVNSFRAALSCVLIPFTVNLKGISLKLRRFAGSLEIQERLHAVSQKKMLVRTSVTVPLDQLQGPAEDP